jgi:lipoprotein-anchoring transpeptidase ErfK/SrfK
MGAYLPFARRAIAAACLALLPLAAAEGHAGPALETAAAALRPGQYQWNGAAASDGPVRIVVSIPLQRAFVYRGAVLVGVSTVSTGRPGYDTPTGAFTILEKDEDHHSNLYEDAPMPFMLRLTWDGVALHAGAVGAEPSSHGCIRLPAAFAKRLYAMTDLGATVIVTDEEDADGVPGAGDDPAPPAAAASAQ